MKFNKIIFFTLSVSIVLLMSCSSGGNLKISQADSGDALKLILDDGTIENVYFTGTENGNFTYVSASDHTRQSIPANRILRAEKLDIYYDNLAHPISSAEIEKYKTNKNTWGFAVGGAVIGGAAGLVAALPFWYAGVEGFPPYFAAGGGAILGSIFFAIKGQDKDKNMAVAKIRYLRDKERLLESELRAEREKLRQLDEERKRIEQQIKKD